MAEGGHHLRKAPTPTHIHVGILLHTRWGGKEPKSLDNQFYIMYMKELIWH